MNPFEATELTAQNYFRYPFRSICSCKQMTEYIVMDVDHIRDKDIKVPIGPRSDRVIVLFNIYHKFH